MLCEVQGFRFAISTYLDLLEQAGNECEEASSTEGGTEGNCDTLKAQWRTSFEGHYRKKVIFAGKLDLKSAFRILGLSKQSWKWLVMKAQDPQTEEWYYFVDKCLPFGSSIICSHFQCFSDALYHLIEFKLNSKKHITNYLDDFLFIALTIVRCNFMLQSFIDLCTDLGVPVSMEKTVWAAELMVFLGILLDGRNMLLCIPEEKRHRAIDLLSEMMNKNKATSKSSKPSAVF